MEKEEDYFEIFLPSLTLSDNSYAFWQNPSKICLLGLLKLITPLVNCVYEKELSKNEAENLAQDYF